MFILSVSLSIRDPVVKHLEMRYAQSTLHKQELKTMVLLKANVLFPSVR